MRKSPATYPNVPLPNYKRSDLSAGIVHIGVGNFHRAHLGVYLHRLFEQGMDRDWGVIGTSVRPEDSQFFNDLEKQDLCTTVVEQSDTGETVLRTCPMVSTVHPGTPGKIVRSIADPTIRIVSLTVTEGGYLLSSDAESLDTHHPLVVWDCLNPGKPKTCFGMIAAAIAMRKTTGSPGLTILSCDNLTHNGARTRDVVSHIVHLAHPDAEDWFERNVRFPNSMVDRITPATTDTHRDYLSETYGISERQPVFCEDHIQWVLEDCFASGRPRFENVGVQLCKDVSPFETMKLRILNGGHAAIAYPAAIRGQRTVAEAMADPLIRGFLIKLVRDEIIPVLPHVPDTDLTGYLDSVTRRFSNRNLEDTIARLCQDGSNRQSKFVVPTIRDRLSRGLPIDGITMASAFWCRFCAGSDECGSELALADEEADTLRRLAAASRDDPAVFLKFAKVFEPVSNDARFVRTFANQVKAIWNLGTREVLRQYLIAKPFSYFL